MDEALEFSEIILHHDLTSLTLAQLLSNSRLRNMEAAIRTEIWALCLRSEIPKHLARRQNIPHIVDLLNVSPCY